MALADFQTLVDDKLRDEEDRVSDVQRDAAIGRAVLRYSQDKPKRIIEDVTGDGTAYLPLPASWWDGESEIASIEYPVGDYPPNYLEEWSLYEAPDETKIMLPLTVANGAGARIKFGGKHTLDGLTDTVPEAHRAAVCDLAAADCFEQLASATAGDQDSTIQADSVQHGNKSRRYQNRADALRARYFEMLGITPNKNAPAGTVKDVDLADSRGRDRLFKRRAFR